jgi:sugar phosphate isomerase/epimerase
MFDSRHIYCPVQNVIEAAPRISELGLGVEILFDDTAELYPHVKWENLLGLADVLADEGIDATVHGPFHGINLGAGDSHVREFSLQALLSGLEAARTFRSPLMVFHAGYLPQYPPRTREKWMRWFCEGLERLLERAGDLEVRLALENTYEHDTTLFQEIFEHFPTPALGMCLDAAHATCYGRVHPSTWSLTFAERICHVHLSDNDGRDDLHWDLGRGVVDLRTILTPLARIESSATVTFETPLETGEVSRDLFFNMLQSMRNAEHSL